MTSEFRTEIPHKLRPEKGQKQAAAEGFGPFNFGGVGHFLNKPRPGGLGYSAMVCSLLAMV